MVKDRLEEFQKNAKLTNSDQDDELPERKLLRNQPLPSESTELLREEHWEDIDGFLNHIENLHSKMAEMGEYLKDMQEIHDTILKSPFTTDPTDTLNKNLNFKDESFKSHSVYVNNVLKAMNRDLSVESNEADFRIKKNQMMTTILKFYNLLIEFNNEQVRWRDQQRQRIRAYLQITGVEMDDDAIEEAIENGSIYNTTSILMTERDTKTKFEDVKSSPEDISKRLAVIREFSEIFLDMSMLVESQRDILDNIEANINAATDYANRAFQNVINTKKARNRNIKLKIFAAICLIILILIILIIILFFVGKAVF